MFCIDLTVIFKMRTISPAYINAYTVHSHNIILMFVYITLFTTQCLT